jgi:hypothetical protein
MQLAYGDQNRKLAQFSKEAKKVQLYKDTVKK